MIRESDHMSTLIKVDIPESIIPTYEEFVIDQFIKANITISQGERMLGISYNDFIIFLGKRGISFLKRHKKTLNVARIHLINILLEKVRRYECPNNAKNRKRTI